MNACCNANGECIQSPACACHETPLDAQREYEVTHALVIFFACVLGAIALSALVMFGVPR